MDDMDDAEFARAIGNATAPLAYPIEKASAIAGVTRTKIFQAIKAKTLTVRKLGRSTLVEHEELRRWIKALPTKGRDPSDDQTGE